MVILKKTRKILLTFLVILTIFIQPAFANNQQDNSVKAYYYYQSDSQPSSRIPNAIEVQIQQRSNDKVRITTLNFGVDTFDSVSCIVKVTNTSGFTIYNKVHKFTSLFPLISQYNDIYVKDWQKVEVISIYCKDGNDTGFLPDISLTKK